MRAISLSVLGVRRGPPSSTATAGMTVAANPQSMKEEFFRSGVGSAAM
jgi:hypothetical protein